MRNIRMSGAEEMSLASIVKRLKFITIGAFRRGKQISCKIAAFGQRAWVQIRDYN